MADDADTALKIIPTVVRRATLEEGEGNTSFVELKISGDIAECLRLVMRWVHQLTPAGDDAAAVKTLPTFPQRGQRRARENGAEAGMLSGA
jgi:hypothetical protein